MNIHENLTAEEMNLVDNAIYNPNRTEAEQSAVDKFCEMMDDTVEWLESPEIKRFVGE